MRFMIEAINPARLMRRFIVEHVFVHAGYREYGNCNSDAVNATPATGVTEDAEGAVIEIKSLLQLTLQPTKAM